MEYYLDSKNISLVKYVKLQIKNFFKIPNFWWLFGFAFLIYGLALFSLFRADIYYIDDWSRSTDGGNWNNFSRYIASYLMRIAQLGIRNTDIAPLYQIFGICVIIFSSMWLIYALYNKIDKLSILAVAPLGLSPYFLENLSYRYDAFLMSAAVGFAIFPFGFYKNRLAFFIISSICIFLMLGCYQAANSVYIVIGIYIAIFSLFIKRQSVSNVLGFIALWLGGLGVGSIAFKVILLKPVDVYVSSNTLSLSEIAGGGGGNNLLNYLLLLISDFTHPPFFITYLFIISCILFVVIFSLDSKRLFRILGAILFLIFGLLCSFGLYTILQKPLFEPRAFNGIGIYMSLILLSFVILESNRFLKRLSMAVIILFVYGLIIFANAYANALKAQQDYTKFRIELLLNDLQKVAPLDSSYDVTIPNFKNLQGINITESKKIKDSKLDSNIVVFTMQGNIGYAVPTIFTISRYGNIMKRLIPILMNGNFSHGLGLFYILLKSNYHPASFNKNEICENTENKELLLQNSYHSIQKAGKCIFITLYKGNE